MNGTSWRHYLHGGLLSDTASCAEVGSACLPCESSAAALEVHAVTTGPLSCEQENSSSAALSGSNPGSPPQSPTTARTTVPRRVENAARHRYALVEATGRMEYDAPRRFAVVGRRSTTCAISAPP